MRSSRALVCDGFAGNVNLVPEQVSEPHDRKDPEVLKPTLKKSLLRDFHDAVMTLESTSTAELLDHMLEIEAGCRALLVTLNTKNTRQYFDGYLKMAAIDPDGASRLSKCPSYSTKMIQKL